MAPVNVCYWGVKRTSCGLIAISANDPKQTSDADSRNMPAVRRKAVASHQSDARISERDANATGVDGYREHFPLECDPTLHCGVRAFIDQSPAA